MKKSIDISNEMLRWFKQHARILPWRTCKSPYRTWISEIMLQQTQVKTMLPYYERFLSSFPNVRRLAAAKEDEVLAHWQGLGYYSRARNLMKAAKYFVDHHHGEVPNSFEALLKAPGIGPYTAGAIASLAFGIRAPIVDGNILRVFSRLTNSRHPIDQPKVRKQIEIQQLASIPQKNCGTYNESLMELGALICIPATPLCSQCPVQKKCKAHEKNTQHLIPVKSNKTQSIKVDAVALIIKKKTSFLLFRRPEGELMGGMWEFPEWKIDSSVQMTTKTLDPTVLGIKNVSKNDFRWKTNIKRSYTKYQETLHVFEYLGTKSLQLQKPKSWLKKYYSVKEMSLKPLTSAHSKIRSQLLNAKD